MDIDILFLALALTLSVFLGSLLVFYKKRHATLMLENQRLLLERDLARQSITQLELRLVDSERMELRLRESFAALSNEALQRSNQALVSMAQSVFSSINERSGAQLDAQKQSLAHLVSPLKESLEKVDKRIGDIEKERVAAYQSVHEQVRSLVQTQNELRKETGNLARALRAPQARGRWGEMQLRRVCELAGMFNHCDFYEQQSSTREDGSAQRPDMVVRMPGGKSIAVDAKVPLNSYLESLEVASELERERRLIDHAAQLKRHILSLSQKAYWDKLDHSPEFVVLFLPGETFFSAALECDPSLIELGVENRVIVATPTTLIALLRSVAYGWRQESMAENAREISQLGKVLYQRLRDFSERLSDVGDKLRSTVGAFNKSVGSYEARVLPSARRFGELSGLPEADNVTVLGEVDVQARSLRGTEESAL